METTIRMNHSHPLAIPLTVLNWILFAFSATWLQPIVGFFALLASFTTIWVNIPKMAVTVTVIFGAVRKKFIKKPKNPQS